MAAARCWVRGGPPDDEGTLAALAAMGASAAQVAEAKSALAERQAEALLVLPGNWLALRVFLAQAGRWRRKPTGGLDGLDLGQVESALRLLRVARREWQELFEKLMTMEAAALEELNR